MNRNLLLLYLDRCIHLTLRTLGAELIGAQLAGIDRTEAVLENSFWKGKKIKLEEIKKQYLLVRRCYCYCVFVRSLLLGLQNSTKSSPAEL